MEYEITLTALAYGGDAIGRLPDGRAVFVPFGIPGERARLRLIEEKRGFARAELMDVLDPSPDRLAPRCKHFTLCGGCHYQHLPYEKQLIEKTGILRDQLMRIGKIKDPPVNPMIGSTEQWNYRNHVQFHLSHEGKLGFMSSNGKQVLPISECHLPASPINTFWPELGFDPHVDLRRVSLRAGDGDSLLLLLESGDPEPPQLELEAEVSVVHMVGDHALVLAGQDHIFINVLGRDFRVSAASFFQVNTRMAGKMAEYLIQKLAVSLTTGLMDVYCGVGLFSYFLGAGCAQVIGIESSESACEDFAFNLEEFDHIELYEGMAEEVIPNLAVRPEIVLVDPPRAGLDKHVVDGILKLGPRVIAYVSCDPSTLARDAARLIQGGYRLEEVTPFDLFPQTYHIESISIFERG